MPVDHPQRRITVHGILSAVACILMGLMAAQPLLYGNLPFGADTLLHLYRVVQLDELVKQGIWYSRWAPDLAFGYGYPLFNYYAPGVYYLTEALHLIGLDFVPALMGTFVLLLAGAALFTYLFARDIAGHTGALIAAAGYTFAPYFILMTVHTGSVSQVAAMALLPAVFWAFRRATRNGRIGDILIAAIAFAALMLCHNITTFLAAPFLVLYVVMQAWKTASQRSEVRSKRQEAGSQKSEDTSQLQTTRTDGQDVSSEQAKDGSLNSSACHSERSEESLHESTAAKNLRALCGLAVKSSLPPLLALALGLGLTAFYWLPVLTETSLVQLDRTILGTTFDFHSNFVTVADLLALPQTYDPHLIGESLPYAFSLPVLAVAVIGAALLLLRHKDAPLAEAGFALGAVLICAFMTTPASQLLWDAVPMMRFVQFPTRILTIASLFLALLAGIGVGGQKSEVRSQRIEIRCQNLCVVCSFAVASSIIALFAIYAFFWQNITRYPPIPQPAIADFARYERENGWIGTTSLGEYLPATVQTIPAQTVVGQTRFNTASVPPRADFRGARSTALDHSATVASTVPWTAMFNVFMFPGWTAEIDGQDAPIAALSPSGLISVSVPGGLHEISIHFRETPARSAADALSLACGALAALGTLLTLRKRGPATIWPASSRPGLVIPLSTGIAIAVLLIVKTTVIDTHDTFFYRSRYDGTHVTDARKDLAISYDQKIDLIGVDAASSSDTEHSADITLYWRVQKTPLENLSVGVELADSQGFVVGRTDHLHPAGFPVIRWNPDVYSADAYQIALKPGTPPGPYTYKVSVYRYDQPAARLPAFDKNGLLTGTTFDSMSVNVITTTVRRAAPITGATPLIPQIALSATVNANAALIGVDLPFTSSAAGERLPVTLYWRAGPVAATDWDATWVLTKSEGDQWSTEITTEPIAGYPTSQWIEDDTWRAPHTLHIPTATPTGHYRLSIHAPGNPPVFLADIDINGSDHVLSQPAITHTQRAHFSDAAELIGYDIPSSAHPGDVVTVTLLWHAYGETEVRYKTFVHLVDSGDNRITGVDSAPANGARPTSGWMKGEYIVDTRTLQIPQDLATGTYSIKVGLYNESNLQRLTLDDGTNVVTLPTPVQVTR